METRSLPETLYPETDGSIRIAIPEVTRLAVYLNEQNAGERTEEMLERGERILNKAVPAVGRYEAYEIVRGQLRPLPIGASFDSRDGVLYWQPGPGFLGEFRFVVIDREAGTKRNISVTIK